MAEQPLQPEEGQQPSSISTNEETLSSPSPPETSTTGSTEKSDSAFTPPTEVSGGPLGCCLGVLIGLLISVSIALFGRFYEDPLISLFGDNLSLLIRIIMGIVAFSGVIICGRLGWRIGKRFYREYKPEEQTQPRPTRQKKK